MGKSRRTSRQNSRQDEIHWSDLIWSEAHGTWYQEATNGRGEVVNFVWLNQDNQEIVTSSNAPRSEALEDGFNALQISENGADVQEEEYLHSSSAQSKGKAAAYKSKNNYPHEDNERSDSKDSREPFAVDGRYSPNYVQETDGCVGSAGLTPLDEGLDEDLQRAMQESRSSYYVPGAGESSNSTTYDPYSPNDDGIENYMPAGVSAYGDIKIQHRSSSHSKRGKYPSIQELDPGFQIVQQPKRFFTEGRVFRMLWSETAAGANPSSSHGLTTSHPMYSKEYNYTKVRWFVVVKRQLHHSLCLPLSTYGERGAVKPSRGRAKDFAAVYDVKFPTDLDVSREEGIERDPIGLIIEAPDQVLSPKTRIDFSRIYTVEDNVKVMKVGRVRPEDIPLLEWYTNESWERQMRGSSHRKKFR